MDTNKETNAELDGFRNWVAGRKAAAATIDMQTCDLWWEHTQILDPYGLFRAEGTFTEEEYQIGRVYFARSPDSDGPVCEYDLSPVQREAMYALIELGDAELKLVPLLITTSNGRSDTGVALPTGSSCTRTRSRTTRPE